jgi:hypothetical protein
VGWAGGGRNEGTGWASASVGMAWVAEPDQEELWRLTGNRSCHRRQSEQQFERARGRRAGVTSAPSRRVFCSREDEGGVLGVVECLDSFCVRWPTPPSPLSAQ